MFEELLCERLAEYVAVHIRHILLVHSLTLELSHHRFPASCWRPWILKQGAEIDLQHWNMISLTFSPYFPMWKTPIFIITYSDLVIVCKFHQCWICSRVCRKGYFRSLHSPWFFWVNVTVFWAIFWAMSKDRPLALRQINLGTSENEIQLILSCSFSFII